jgi:hypothetical protein
VSHVYVFSSIWSVILLTVCIQILNHLKDWSGPIEALRRAFKSATRTTSKKSKGKKPISNVSTIGNEIVLPHHASQEVIAAYNDIHTLFRALQHATASNLHNILSHMELMTSAVSWFAQVSECMDCPERDAHRYFCQRHIDFPESAKQLGEALME